MSATDSPHPIPMRAVASWVLYDLANTIFSMGVVSLFFSAYVRTQVGAERADMRSGARPLTGQAFALRSLMLMVLVSYVILKPVTDERRRW